jgi:hypothetical protein
MPLMDPSLARNKQLLGDKTSDEKKSKRNLQENMRTFPKCEGSFS